jgi:thymidylate synthase (FAD)
MQRIKVKLLNSTPISVALTAVAKPYQNENPTKELFVKVAKTMKHESVMEHIYFSFDIDGISRLCLQELARHRIASLTVCSTRFTLQKMLNNTQQLKQYFVFPNHLTDQQLENYQYYLTKQIYQLKKFSQGIEDNDILKYLLPESFRTSLVWTINARSLNNFFKLRRNNKAHFEIRYLAELIYALVSPMEYLFDE